MNSYVLRRVDPARAATLLSAIYGGMFLALALVGLPILLIAPTPQGVAQPFPKYLGIFMVLIYPLFGALFGWLAGHLIALIYNLAARKFGGLVFEADRIV